jgi:hypothetical protein
LFGVKKAIDLRLLKLEEFDLKEYETFEKVEHGDYNWLSPHFIAFASPVESANGRIGKAFKLIMDQFERVGVKLVIRLNKKLYDETRFTKRGIAHRESQSKTRAFDFPPGFHSLILYISLGASLSVLRRWHKSHHGNGQGVYHDI